MIIRAWVGNLKQRVPIGSKSSKFKGETQLYVVKLPKSAGARHYCPKILNSFECLKTKLKIKSLVDMFPPHCASLIVSKIDVSFSSLTPLYNFSFLKWAFENALWEIRKERKTLTLIITLCLGKNEIKTVDIIYSQCGELISGGTIGFTR